MAHLRRNKAANVLVMWLSLDSRSVRSGSGVDNDKMLENKNEINTFFQQASSFYATGLFVVILSFWPESLCRRTDA